MNLLRLVIRFATLGLVGLIGFQLGSNERLNRSLSFKNPTVLFSGVPSLLVEDGFNKSSLLLSYQQSFGFFDDIKDDEWRLLQKKVKDVYPNTNGDPYQRNEKALSKYFYQNHYEPDFACHHERRIGKLGDGGKWVCDPHRLAAPTTISINSSALDANSNAPQEQPPPPPCLVYSIGSNGDASFERSIKHDIGDHCEIHVFDMGNYEKAVSPTGAIYHRWGLSHEATTKRNQVYKTLYQTIHELGHLGRPIDIFKIDCEGCEKRIFNDFFLPGIDLRQILIELHGDPGTVEQRAKKLDRPVAIPETPDFFKAMYQHGYVIFHKEPNIQWSVGAWAIEYCFVKLHPNFFQDIPQLYQTMELSPVSSSNHSYSTTMNAA